MPVGLIHSSWGGTPIEAWMSPEALGKDADFKPIEARYEQAKAADTPENFKVKMDKYKEAKAKWEAAVAAAKTENKPKPQGEPRPPQHAVNQNSPSTLYNGMIVPILPYANAGSTWYQGEIQRRPRVSISQAAGRTDRRLAQGFECPRTPRSWSFSWRTSTIPNPNRPRATGPNFAKPRRWPRSTSPRRASAWRSTSVKKRIFIRRTNRMSARAWRCRPRRSPTARTFPSRARCTIRSRPTATRRR